MEKGKIIYDFPSLEEIRKRTLENLSKLPMKYKRLKNAPHYPVVLSLGLKKMLNELTSELKKIEVESPV